MKNFRWYRWWKGGEFLMGEHTPLHIARKGGSVGHRILNINTTGELEIAGPDGYEETN